VADSEQLNRHLFTGWRCYRPNVVNLVLDDGPAASVRAPGSIVVYHQQVKIPTIPR
jgi:hypothetical protein